MVAGDIAASARRERRSPAGGKRLKVLLVTDHLGHANGVIHGASRYYLQVLPRIDRERFDVRLCILRGWHPFAAELEEAGVRPLFLNRGKWDPRALRDLDRLVQREQVDVLHCLAMKGCLFGRMVARRRGIPALIHLHDTNDPGAVIGFLQRRIAPWTTRALAVSSTVRRYTVEQMGIAPEHTEVLYNGLDVEAFARPEPGARERIRRELKIAPGAPVVLVAGRVVQGKGQRELIGAWPGLLEDVPGAVLVVAGDGADLPACREAAQRAGIEQAVRFLGQRRDMPELLAASDIAAVPSLVEEGFGYSAVEASAAGRPVVAFDAGALGEVVLRDETGVLVGRGDVNGFIEAVARLLRDEASRREMGQAGAAHARRFGIEAHVQRLQDIYLEVAGVEAAGIRPGSR